MALSEKLVQITDMRRHHVQAGSDGIGEVTDGGRLILACDGSINIQGTDTDMMKGSCKRERKT